MTDSMTGGVAGAVKHGGDHALAGAARAGRPVAAARLLRDCSSSVL
ncbi:MAG: hypothetical protein MZV70_20435 [Desulfobacterales bacterium]|nr:hypothetical protein [Desulfobacterales bacterium]